MAKKKIAGGEKVRNVSPQNAQKQTGKFAEEKNSVPYMGKNHLLLGTSLLLSSTSSLPYEQSETKCQANSQVKRELLGPADKFLAIGLGLLEQFFVPFLLVRLCFKVFTSKSGGCTRQFFPLYPLTNKLYQINSNYVVHTASK